MCISWLIYFLAVVKSASVNKDVHSLHCAWAAGLLISFLLSAHSRAGLPDQQDILVLPFGQASMLFPIVVLRISISANYRPVFSLQSPQHLLLCVCLRMFAKLE